MSDSWETFRCRMPLETYRLLEDELERIKNLAEIDPDDRMSQEVRDGLAMEFIIALSAATPDESVM